MVIDWWWIGKDVEASVRGLTEGSIPAFAWRDWEKSEKPQDRRSPGRDLKPGPPEYEAGVLTSHIMADAWGGACTEHGTCEKYTQDRNRKTFERVTWEDKGTKSVEHKPSLELRNKKISVYLESGKFITVLIRALQRSLSRARWTSTHTKLISLTSILILSYHLSACL
jgi:hypothetical protein